VWVLSLGKTEFALEISFQEWSGVNSRKNTGINGDLIFFSLSGGGIFFLCFFEDSFFSLFGGLSSLEVGVVNTFWDGDSRDVDLGGCSDNLGWDGTSEWDAVDLVWSGDKGQTRFQLFKEHNSLPSVGRPKIRSVSSCSVPLALRPEVFDADFYLKTHPDLGNAGLHTKEQATNHWCSYGIREGRQAISSFHSKQYLDIYSDLQKAFGNDYGAAIVHYINNGIAEGRVGIN